MKKKVMYVLMSVLVLATMIVPTFAAEETSVTYDTFSTVMSALTGQISVTTVVAILSGVVGACVGLVFMWWGIRKAISALMSAFKKGRVSI